MSRTYLPYLQDIMLILNDCRNGKSNEQRYLALLDNKMTTTITTQEKKKDLCMRKYLSKNILMHKRK